MDRGDRRLVYRIVGPRGGHLGVLGLGPSRNLMRLYLKCATGQCAGACAAVVSWEGRRHRAGPGAEEPAQVVGRRRMGGWHERWSASRDPQLMMHWSGFTLTCCWTCLHSRCIWMAQLGTSTGIRIPVDCAASLGRLNRRSWQGLTSAVKSRRTRHSKLRSRSACTWSKVARRKCRAMQLGLLDSWTARLACDASVRCSPQQPSTDKAAPATWASKPPHLCLHHGAAQGTER